MIELQGLTKRYGQHTAVDDLTVTVRPGIVTGFLGPNGAGKSTTMRMILGLDQPDAGSALVDGRAYRQHQAPLHEVGALLEARAMHPGRSARNHLLSLAVAAGIDRRRVDEVLDLAGIAAVAGRHVGGFSLGMRQRLGVATALLGDPGVVMLDEPVNGLDPDGVLWIRNLIRSLAAEGRTVFLSSHLMSEMALTADQLVIVGRGRLIADTTTAELLARHGGCSVRVRTPQPEALHARLRATASGIDTPEPSVLVVQGMSSEAIGAAAAAAAITLYELTTDRPSLEEAFMSLTRDSLEYRADSTQAGDLTTGQVAA